MFKVLRNAQLKSKSLFSFLSLPLSSKTTTFSPSVFFFFKHKLKCVEFYFQSLTQVLPSLQAHAKLEELGFSTNAQAPQPSTEMVWFYLCIHFRLLFSQGWLHWLPLWDSWDLEAGRTTITNSTLSLSICANASLR